MLAYSAPLFVVAGMLLSMTQEALPQAPVMPEVPVHQVSERVLGFSEAGRKIMAYEIGSGSECQVFFGGIHGNERGTVDLMVSLVKELVANPELVAADKRVLVIPLVNPDGYFDRTDKLNANGVNLNRNFATQDWIEKDGDEQTFAGLEPFSEIESRLLREAVNTCDPSLMVAYHSQGALVSPEFNFESVALGKWYAEQTGYAYYDEWDYAGTATRWFAEATGRAAITIELTSHADSDWEINRSALLRLILGS